jgi:hypothetical protein
LAQQFGEDPDEIFELARKNELRTLFTRTDIQPAPVPTPLVVAQRSMPNTDADNATVGVPLDVRQKQLALMERKMAMDTPAIDVRLAQLELMRRKIDMDADDGLRAVEHRSLMPPPVSWRQFDPRE